MKPSGLVLNGNESKAVDVIHRFLNRQRALVCDLRKTLGEDTDVFSLKRRVPKTIDALGETWAVAAHGVGVGFTSTTTGEVVDVHVGLFDAPDAFDAWRIEPYAESIHADREHFGPILERLASKGVISRHPSLADHYEWPASFAT